MIEELYIFQPPATLTLLRSIFIYLFICVRIIDDPLTLGILYEGFNYKTNKQTKRSFFIILILSDYILLQWLCFFIFLAVILPNKTLCKPFELEAPREDFADDKLEPNVAYQNNTTDVRSKREVKTLRDICNAGHYRISSNGCVKRWLICYDYQEAECDTFSFKCLSSIPRCGSPKCRPIYDFVEVSLSGTVQKFRRTKNCVCAWRLQEN